MTSNEFLTLFKEQNQIIDNAKETIEKAKKAAIETQAKDFNVGDKVRVTTGFVGEKRTQFTLEGFITGWDVCENTGEAYPTLHAIKKDGTEANKNVSVAYLSWYGVEKIELI